MRAKLSLYFVVLFQFACFSSSEGGTYKLVRVHHFIQNAQVMLNECLECAR